MRPLLLKMTAFGPYVQEQVVDFDAFTSKGRNFFLIHGPTGSGKTSLLDAMCFALYGRSTGLRDTYRSHHADENLLTSVVFEFALGAHRYRAERRMTKTGRIVPRLEEWKDGDWNIIVERKDFAFYIKQLLGFDVDQFRQVVMLPQGQFSRFLLASSKEKEGILKTLFGTDRYEQITATLKERAQSEDARYTALESARRTHLAGQNAESLAELRERQPVITEELNRLKEVEAELATRQQELARKVSEAEALHKIFIEFDTITEALERCQADEVHRNRDEERLKRAERAVDLEPAYDRIQELKNQLQLRAGQLQKAEAEHRASQERLQALQKQDAALKEAEPERQARLRRIEELQLILPDWERFQEERRRLQQVNSTLERLEARIAELQAERQKTAQHMEALEAELAGLRGTASSKDFCEQALAEWQRILRQKAQLSEKETRLSELQKQAAGLVEEEAVLQASLAEINRSIEEAEEQERQMQAAVLAASLAPGKPCPVCGSEHHPAPAVAEEGQKQPLLASLRRELENRREKHAEAARRLVACRTEEQHLVQGIAELRAELGPWAEASAGQQNEEEKRRQEALRLAIEAGQREGQLQAEQADLKALLHDLEKELERLHEERPLMMREQQTLSVSVARNEERFSSMDNVAVSAELDRLCRLRDEDEQARKQLQQDLEAAMRQEASAQAGLESMKGRHAEDSTLLKSQSQAFEKRLAALGWENEKQFLADRMPLEEREALKQKIHRYDVERQRLEARHGELKETIGQSERPDLPSLQKELKQLQEEQSRVITEKGILSERHTTLLRTIETVARLEKDQEDLRRRRDLWKGLADAASGLTGRRITLQRYILAYRLEEVLGNASERLRRMTQGRYSLRRAAENDDMRQAFGLDLVVYDHRTGKIRPVSSLSGGESFLASLALALALSSVVQSRTGGIRLDTILIDEGFGSLDPEALDLALSTLKQLQEGGRLVGVISHVEEIRQQVEARIEVIPGPSGSRLQMHA